MLRLAALGRVLPFGFGGRRSLLLIERNILVYKNGWLVILSGFFEPLFYLLSIGLGIGGIVGDLPGPNGTTIPYALFVAPALLASASMNGAIAESTFNVFFKLNYQKTYDAVLATPLSPGDVALGEIGWAVIRSTLYALGFVVVILLLGLVRSPWAVFAVPAATLLAFAFAAVGMAATTFMRSWQDFDLINLVVLPLFLFSPDPPNRTGWSPDDAGKGRDEPPKAANEVHAGWIVGLRRQEVAPVASRTGRSRFLPRLPPAPGAASGRGGRPVRRAAAGPGTAPGQRRTRPPRASPPAGGASAGGPSGSAARRDRTAAGGASWR